MRVRIGASGRRMYSRVSVALRSCASGRMPTEACRLAIFTVSAHSVCVLCSCGDTVHCFRDIFDDDDDDAYGRRCGVAAARKAGAKGEPRFALPGSIFIRSLCRSLVI